MANHRERDDLGHIFDTRGSVLAAWFVSVVVVWPILCLIVTIAVCLCVQAVWVMLHPDSDGTALGMMMGLAVAPPVFALSAIVTAVACYKACRYLTVSWREAKPLAFEFSTVMSVLISLVVAFVFWAVLLASELQR